MESLDHLHQLTALRHSLAETIAWCAMRATITDPERCLRTPASFRPAPACCRRLAYIR
jgi:hypothetical protein